MEEGCILPGITAGNTLCLPLNRPEQGGGIITVKERLGRRNCKGNISSLETGPR